MNRVILILGVIILIVGIAGAGYYGFATRTRVYVAYGVAIFGVLIAIGGAMMATPGAGVKGQFACAKCGAAFGSQSALDQHTKDKHGM